MKAPSILFISRRYPPSVGGLEQFAFDLSSALEQKITLRRVVWRGKSRISAVLIQPWLFVVSLWQLILHRDITVLHSQDAVTAPMVWLLAKLSRKPWLTMVHGLDLTYDNWFYQTVVLWFVRRAGAVVANSENTRREAVKKKISAEKISVITPGISDFLPSQTQSRQKLLDSIRLGKLADTHLLLTVGRLTKRKGVAWFIGHVLPELCKTDPDLRYIVVGAGEDQRQIETLIRAKHLEERVFLLGVVTGSQKTALYQACDIFVMPNIVVPGDVEGFGIVAIEAAVAGMPVVASRLEGIRDALHDQKNGWLVEPSDALGYRQAITKLLASPTLRHERGVQARDYTLARFAWGRVADAFVGVYQKLGATPRSSRSLRLTLSLVILALTFVALLVYAEHNPKVLAQFRQVSPGDLVELIPLYVGVFASQLAVLYFSLRFYGKRILLSENFLVSSYSSLTNFFGPTQAGSGVRAVYLKAKMKVGIKDFIFVSLLYYACYASLSIVMLFTGAGRIVEAAVALVLVGLFSASVVGWYKKSRKLKSKKVNLEAVIGIFIATFTQVTIQSVIYFLEIVKLDHGASFAHAVSYTGAANFSLFVSLTPGAIGIRESFLVFSESLHHISSDVIVGAGLIDRAVYIVFLGLLFVLVTMLHGRRKLQRLRGSE